MKLRKDGAPVCFSPETEKQALRLPSLRSVSPRMTGCGHGGGAGIGASRTWDCGSVFDAALGEDAFLVGVFDFAHLGYGVGELD